MLWTILVVLLILWLIGFGTGVVGNLIHLVLVVALVCCDHFLRAVAQSNCEATSRPRFNHK